MNPYYNYFRDETLLAILIAIRPLCTHLKQEIIDIIRIAITIDGDIYEFEEKDFADRPYFSLLK